MKKIDRPNPSDAPSWYGSFFDIAPGEDLLAALLTNEWAVQRLLERIDVSRADYRYDPSKWTLKQVLIHLTDEERYYTYKAFCCSRGSSVMLEVPMSKDYCADFNSDNRKLTDIGEELLAVRESTITLFQTMTPQMLDLRDESQNEIYTARSLGWFTVGHSNHHLKILKEKYLNI